MKTLLINPYVPQEVIYGKSAKGLGAVLPPLGIFYIASYMKEVGKGEITLLDACALKKSPEDILEVISANAFDCVGLSSTTLAYPYAVEIAALIKERFPKMTLLLGGPHAQGASDTILKENGNIFDYVCYGDGEFAFESLYEHFNGTKDKADLKGWKYLENNQIITASPTAVPENLDVFGHPINVVPPELVPLYHEKAIAYKQLPMFSLMASRGCPFQCTFCSTPEKFKNLYQKKVRFHSIDWICEELKILSEKYGVKEVIFVDDTFNLDKKRVIEFCERKIRDGNEIVWSCNFEANIVDYEIMVKMKESGCWAIMVGGESGSDRVLKFIKKGVTAAQLTEVGELANKLGICSRVSFILGLPSDTEESIRETLEFVRKSDFHFPYFQLYVPLPGTIMYEQLNDYGKVINLDAKNISACQVNYLPHGVSHELLFNLYKNAHKKTYLRWKFVLNHLQFIRSFSDLKRYFSGLLSLLNL